ncbi:glycosyltransferase [Pseudoxanthomonas sp. LjRoot125]|uniref:glycosyltransferase n=1 Tax=Pseudoxanthomonas sp. LjRoot125 TaxID=3342258 RepID=UPI003E120200
MSDGPAILLITSSFPIKGDGSEAAGAFVADLADELASSRFVKVVAPGRRAEVESWSARVQVHRYPTSEAPLSTLKPWVPWDALEILRTLRSGQKATEAAMASGPVERIIALWVLPCGDWAMRSAKRHGVPYAAWALGSDIWSLGRIPFVRRRLAQVMRGASKRWADGVQLAHDAETICGAGVEFLPSTRRTARRRIEPLRSRAPYRLLFLGRWHPNKGIDLLLDALAMLGNEDWALIERVVVCGGGPLEDIVREKMSAFASNGRPVELRGFLAREAAEQALLDADWLLIPSRVESIPVVFSDAMKMRCAVVAMPVGDLPGLINVSRVGVVAREVSARAFAGALSEALRNSPAVLGDNLDQTAVQFDLPSIADKILKRWDTAE